eukprot:8490606-Ditylum_brightwellii.AAC.1
MPVTPYPGQYTSITKFEFDKFTSAAKGDIPLFSCISGLFPFSRKACRACTACCCCLLVYVSNWLGAKPATAGSMPDHNTFLYGLAVAPAVIAMAALVVCPMFASVLPLVPVVLPALLVVALLLLLSICVETVFMTLAPRTRAKTTQQQKLPMQILPHSFLFGCGCISHFFLL